MAYDYAKIQTFEKSQINGLTKRLSSMVRYGAFTERAEGQRRLLVACSEVGLKNSHEDYDCDGTAFMFKKPRSITAEQTAFGIAWLKDYFYNSKGQIRRGKRTEDVPRYVLERAHKVIRFKFVGVIGLRNGMNEYAQFIPTYRAYCADGSWFDYSPIYWGKPVIGLLSKKGRE